jgi:hypothetical protein
MLLAGASTPESVDIHERTRQIGEDAMADAAPKLTKFEDKVLDSLTQVQESVVDGLRSVVSRIEGSVPDVTVPYGDKLPTADDVVDNGFGFAEKVLFNQKHFADEVLVVTAPVRDKFTPEAKPASTKKATKKAA